MMLCEWRDFSTDVEGYTREIFEDLIGDEFEAMMYKNDADTFPSYIWTVNFVVILKRNARMYNDLSFIKIPRNPVCE